MSLAVLADHMASQGRNGDTMLVHMAPDEVAGLHALALAHGKSLTINPETGLPEAFSLRGLLKSLLPAIAGFALGPAGFGLMSAMQAGLAVGAVTGLAKGSLKEGIMAGLGAYGGANLGAAFTGAESAGATTAAAEAAKTASQEAVKQGLTGEAANQFAQQAATKAYTDFAAQPMLDQAAGSFTALKNAPGAMGGLPSLAKPAMYAAAPMAEQMLAPPTVEMPSLQQRPGLTFDYTYTPFGGFTFGGVRGAKAGGLVALAEGGFTDERVAQALRESMGQGFSLEQSLGGAASKFGISQEQLGRAQALLNAPPAPTPAPAAAPAPLTPAEYAAKSFITAEERGPLGTLSQEAQTQLALEEAKRGISANLNAQQIANLVNAKYQKDFTEQNVLDFMKAQGLSFPQVAVPTPPVSVTPDLFPGVTGTAPGTAVTGTPAIDYAAAPTMEQVRSDYVKGGGRTDMPTITDIQPTDRTYTQNEAFALLQGYLKTNPNAQYQDVVGFARSKGIPEMQARAAYNEFRFSGLSGGSQQAYDYLMGRGAYPVKPFTPTGELMRPYTEAVLGVPENVRAKQFIFDAATQRYVPNPAFVPRVSSAAIAKENPRDQAGNLLTGNPKSYFVANPDVYAEWLKGKTGMTADEYAKFHWETMGKEEGRKGWTEAASSSSKNNSDSKRQTDIGGKAGGLMDIASAAAARGGNVQQYNLGGYSDGGRLLRGPGDGVSDSIPATIGDRQPARLADGEFVVPARIVSEIGNGSTEAGARKLYKMMDRVQRARAKTTGKGRVAKDTKAEQYLPA